MRAVRGFEKNSGTPGCILKMFGWDGNVILWTNLRWLVWWVGWIVKLDGIWRRTSGVGVQRRSNRREAPPTEGTPPGRQSRYKKTHGKPFLLANCLVFLLTADCIFPTFAAVAGAPLLWYWNPPASSGFTDLEATGENPQDLQASDTHCRPPHPQLCKPLSSVYVHLSL